MKMTFDTQETVDAWRAVNDGVMGGRSSGGPAYDGEHLVFEGVINTNGGGFSSVRAEMEPGQLIDVSGFNMRVKSDGRTYKVTLRTNVRYRWRPVSFQAEIPQTPPGEWAEVFVPFDALKASLFGRPVSGATFDQSDVQELGLIIADGQDGPFRLDVEWIEACENN